jgi:predicted DNA-binding transcriptional regulator AlpA
LTQLSVIAAAKHVDTFRRMTAAQPLYVALADLAARWGVSVGTARNRTKTQGFPVALEVGPRSLRWKLEEVDAWEQREQTARVRRIVTGSRPQHHVAAPRHQPVRVKVTQTRAA